MNPRLPPSVPRILPHLLALALVGCQEQPPPPAFAPPEVVTQKIEARTIPVEAEFIGQTESSRPVEIRTRVEGFLEKRLYEEGSLVRKDQILFQLDPRPFIAALQGEKGALAQEEAKQGNAQRNVARLKNLVAQKAVSQKDVDDAVSELAAADAAVLSARARVTTAELNLSYATIRSPLTGLSSRAKKADGSFVSPGSEGLLTTVAQTDPIWVNFSVSETRLLKVREAIMQHRMQAPRHNNYTVELHLADGSRYPLTGKLNFSDSVIATETGTFGIRAEFPNPDILLHPGQFVRVTLKGATRPDALLVPQRAIQQGPQGKFVYVVGDGDKVEIRPVEVGNWHGNDWIVENGLKNGEQVVVDGMARLMPGMPVKPVPPTAGDTGARGTSTSGAGTSGAGATGTNPGNANGGRS